MITKSPINTVPTAASRCLPLQWEVIDSLTHENRIVMLGKLFGFKKKQPVAAAPTPAAASTANSTPVDKKNPKPSLHTLAQVQSVDELHDIHQLQQLLKNSAQLDKKTNRLLRDRLQTLKTAQQQQQLNHDAQEKICSKLETLAKLQYHPLFDNELAHLLQQWQAITTPDTALAARATTAITRCQQIQTEVTQQKLAEEHAIQQAAAAKAQRAAEIAQQRAEAEAQQALAAEQKAHAIAAQKEQRAAQKDHSKQQKITSRQHELQDWQAFAAIPKLEALCAAMEKLCASTLQPLETAEAVRELQTQWRALKPPHTPEAQALWERFKQASDTAWEPCAAHYEKERQHRAFNLQQRQAICEALEQFAQTQDWQHVDWKGISRILDKSRKEFHDFHPVERQEEKPIRTRFDAAFASINTQLLEIQTANEARKQQLVNTAKSVAEMHDTDKAIERFLQLQEQWKLIGITRHHEDRKLWQALQDAGKTIFDKRRSAQQQQRQIQDDNIAQAKAICERITALATLTDEELAQSSATFEQLQSEYKAIKDIPEKLQPALKKQFSASCDAYHQQLRGITTRQHQKQLAELARRAQLCEQLEKNLDTATAEQLNADWQQISLPAEWEKAIENRKQQALTAIAQQSTLDTKANTQRRRELCIAVEILLDLTTPEEDRQLRRELQLKKLQQGLGQSPLGSPHAALEQLLIDWHCTGSANTEEQTTLQTRFDAALSPTRTAR